MSDFSNNNIFSSLQPSNNEINNILVIMNNILEQNNIISNEEIPLINEEEEDFPDDLPDLISDTFDPSGEMTIQIMNRINSQWNRRSAYIPFLNMPLATSSFIYSPSNVLFRSFNEVGNFNQCSFEACCGVTMISQWIYAFSLKNH